MTNLVALYPTYNPPSTLVLSPGDLPLQGGVVQALPADIAVLKSLFSDFAWPLYAVESHRMQVACNQELRDDRQLGVRLVRIVLLLWKRSATEASASVAAESTCRVTTLLSGQYLICNNHMHTSLL